MAEVGFVGRTFASRRGITGAVSASVFASNPPGLAATTRLKQKSLKLSKRLSCFQNPQNKRNDASRQEQGLHPLESIMVLMDADTNKDAKAYAGQPAAVPFGRLMRHSFPRPLVWLSCLVAHLPKFFGKTGMRVNYLNSVAAVTASTYCCVRLQVISVDLF